MFLSRRRARRDVLCVLVIGGALVTAAPRLAAQAALDSQDIYTISGIAVDERAETAARAREVMAAGTGIQGVAVIREVLAAPNPYKAAEGLCRAVAQAYAHAKAVP